MPVPRESVQNLCDEIQKMGNVLSCHAVNKEGGLLGASYGEQVVDADLRASFPKVTADIWKNLGMVSTLAGPLRIVSAVFEKFKIIGLPIKSTNMALLLTVDVSVDSFEVEEKVNDYVSYWLRVNGYIR